MLAPAFVFRDIVNGFASKFLVRLIDAHLSTVKARAPTSEFVLSLGFCIGETFRLLLGVFFSGGVKGSFLVVYANAIVEIELIFPRAEVLNDALEFFKERQHFSYAKVAIHNPFEPVR